MMSCLIGSLTAHEIGGRNGKGRDQREHQSGDDADGGGLGHGPGTETSMFGTDIGDQALLTSALTLSIR